MGGPTPSEEWMGGGIAEKGVGEGEGGGTALVCTIKNLNKKNLTKKILYTYVRYLDSIQPTPTFQHPQGPSNMSPSKLHVSSV